MAYKKKLEFHFGATLFTILAFPELLAKLPRNSSTEDARTLVILAERNEANRHFVRDVRKILRNDIESNPEQLAKYKENLNDLTAKVAPQEIEFSIKIVGSGTKEQIARQLELMSYAVKSYTLEELRNGVTDEESCIIMTTDLPEAYEGERE
jgi:hypothetical protein